MLFIKDMIFEGEVTEIDEASASSDALPVASTDQNIKVKGKNFKWNYEMECELIRIIMKHKAHVVTTVEKGVKWERVLENVKSSSVFKKVIEEHEVCKARY